MASNVIANINITDEQLEEIKQAVIDHFQLKKGKWIDCKCSNCGFQPIIKPIAIDLTAEPRLKNTYNYCPNCGVEMEEK